MGFKITDYPIKTVFNSTDLLDFSTDIGGGSFQSERLTLANLETYLNGSLSFSTPNATHTSEVTGDGALTVQPLAISNKALITATGTMEMLVNDAGTLKKIVASDFLAGGADTNFATDDLTFTGNREHDLGLFNLTLDGTGASTGSRFNVTAKNTPGNALPSFKVQEYGGVEITANAGGTYGINQLSGGDGVSTVFSTTYRGGGTWNTLGTDDINIGDVTAGDYIKFDGVAANLNLKFIANNSTLHEIYLGSSNGWASFFRDGWVNGWFAVGGFTPLGSEQISLQGTTRIGDNARIDGECRATTFNVNGTVGLSHVEVINAKTFTWVSGILTSVV